MAEKLFGFKDRDEAHKSLEKVLKKGDHPRACCWEDANDPEPYQVWSDSPPPNVAVPDPPRKPTEVEGAMLERLSDLVVAKLLAASLPVQAKKEV